MTEALSSCTEKRSVEELIRILPDIVHQVRAWVACGVSAPSPLLLPGHDLRATTHSSVRSFVTRRNQNAVLRKYLDNMENYRRQGGERGDEAANEVSTKTDGGLAEKPGAADGE